MKLISRLVKPLQGKDPCFCVETLHSTAMLPGETQTPQTTTGEFMSLRVYTIPLQGYPEMSPAHLQVFILARCSLLKPGYQGQSCLGAKVRMT